MQVQRGGLSDSPVDQDVSWLHPVGFS
jgi:hypothetical protein